MKSITTELTARLGIDHPILLAPMGDAAGGHPAAAVSRAGGLGLIGGGYADPGWLEPQLDAAGDARVGVGFITFALDEHPDTLAMALERTPVAIQLSFGDPEPYPDRIHASGAVLICQVQTRAEAIHAVRCGADVIVAQKGFRRPRPLRAEHDRSRTRHRRCRSPAPGRGRRRDRRRSRARRRADARRGRNHPRHRLLATTEAICDPTAAELLVTRRGDDTTRTEAFDVIRGPAWPDGYDGRALRNDITDRWAREPLGPAERERLAEAYRQAPAEDYAIRVLWTGDALDLIHAIEPAGDVIAAVVDDALRRLESAATAVRSQPEP